MSTRKLAVGQVEPLELGPVSGVEIPEVALDQGVLTRSRLLARADELGSKAALRIERALHRGER